MKLSYHSIWFPHSTPEFQHGFPNDQYLIDLVPWFGSTIHTVSTGRMLHTHHRPEATNLKSASTPGFSPHTHYYVKQGVPALGESSFFAFFYRS